MEIITIPCKYNDGKTYVIKRYKCGHYYANQFIKPSLAAEIYEGKYPSGCYVYKSFQKISKKTLRFIQEGNL